MIVIRLTNGDGSIVSDVITMKTAAGDGFFEVQSISFSTEQTLNIGSASSGAGAGKIVFNPFSFTLASGPLDATFLAKQASGDSFKTMEVLIIRTPSGQSAVPTTPPSETFNMSLVAVKTLALSAGTDNGTTQVSLEYGALVISAPAGGAGKTVTGGWNRVTNQSDQTLVTKLS